MDRLIQILARKPINDNTKLAILSLYEPAVNFWGKDKEELILKTIENFEIYNLEDLGKTLIKYQGRVDSSKGIDINTAGLCLNFPISIDGKITDVRRVILLESQKSNVDTAFLIAHELFFHGVKSIIQPNLGTNVLMMGLEETKYLMDSDNNILDMKSSGGFGFEELSTYYGQYRLMKDTYDITIDIDPSLMCIALSVGNILEFTEFGSLILEAQITKDTTKLKEYFSRVASKSREIGESNIPSTWDEYSKLMDDYINLYYQASSLEEIATPQAALLNSEYNKTYQKVLSVNSQIFLSSTMLEIEEVAKRKVLKNKNKLIL